MGKKYLFQRLKKDWVVITNDILKKLEVIIAHHVDNQMYGITNL